MHRRELRDRLDAIHHDYWERWEELTSEAHDPDTTPGRRRDIADELQELRGDHNAAEAQCERDLRAHALATAQTPRVRSALAELHTFEDSYRAHLRRRRRVRSSATAGIQLAPAPTRSAPRARGAGRPAGRTQRATRAGPSGDDDGPSDGPAGGRPDDDLTERRCACGELLAKPARGPWPARCCDCQSRADAARKRAARAARRDADPDHRGLRLSERLRVMAPAEALAAFRRLAAPERAELVEALGIERDEEILLLIVAPRLNEGTA